jgi:hypothetical protein
MGEYEKTLERCPDPASAYRGDRHGVARRARRDRDGNLIEDKWGPDATRYLGYQEGECMSCGQTVYSERNPDEPPETGWHDWRTKSYVIHEEETVNELLTGLS